MRFTAAYKVMHVHHVQLCVPEEFVCMLTILLFNSQAISHSSPALRAYYNITSLRYSTTQDSYAYDCIMPVYIMMYVSQYRS